MTDQGKGNQAKKILLLAAGLLLAFGLGFGSQWLRANALQGELTRTEADVRMLDLGSRLGAALAESQRGNYERARQLMADFFSDLQAELGRIEDPELAAELQEMLGQRDELITQLSRAEPEAASRLNLMYTRYFAATHPLGSGPAATVTPSPP